MLVYRIVHHTFSASLFASGLAGRWNTQGKKVIYTAESIPLAFLENMVRRQGMGFNHDFKIMIIEIPDAARISEIKTDSLKEGWRDFNDYFICQKEGDAWYDKSDTLLLKVPSAILPEAFNYVLHSQHSDFSNIKLVAVTDLVPDVRIEDILKRYRK